MTTLENIKVLISKKKPENSDRIDEMLEKYMKELNEDFAVGKEHIRLLIVYFKLLESARQKCKINKPNEAYGDLSNAQSFEPNLKKYLLVEIKDDHRLWSHLK